MNAFTSSVSKKLLLLIVLHIQVSVSLSVAINKLNNKIPNIVSKSVIELKAVTINYLLNDVIRISVPVIDERNRYYLTNPNGDTIKLDLPKLDFNKTYYPPNRAVTSIIQDTNKWLQADSFEIFKVNFLDEVEKYLRPNEFLLGPLLEEDYGNWVLSIFTEDIDGEWIEMYQTFTISITELIELAPRQPELWVGDTFNLSFAYSIPMLESCEIVAPRSTFDRFYTRTMSDVNKCDFTMPNVTKEDEGIWRIIGVGRIVYTGAVRLNVIGDSAYLQT